MKAVPGRVATRHRDFPGYFRRARNPGRYADIGNSSGADKGSSAGTRRASFLGELEFHVHLQGRDLFHEHRRELQALAQGSRHVLGHELDAGGNRVYLGKAEGFGGARNLLRHALDVRDGRGSSGNGRLGQAGAHLRDLRLGAREEAQRQRVLRHLRRTGITGMGHCNPPWRQQSCMA